MRVVLGEEPVRRVWVRLASTHQRKVPFEPIFHRIAPVPVPFA